jgi:hypothetical protein
MASTRIKRKPGSCGEGDDNLATYTTADTSGPIHRTKRLKHDTFRFMDLPQELKDMVYHEL